MPPLSIATDVTPLMIVGCPPVGVNDTPLQFMNLLVADMMVALKDRKGVDLFGCGWFDRIKAG